VKLRYSSTSPYVRKVVVVALETGLDGRIERIATSTADPKSGLAEQNPLGKVPAFLTDDGMVLYDSPVICEYLDSLHGGRRVIPAQGAARWAALRQQARADGILDAAILRRQETARPAGEQSKGWIEKQRSVVARAVDALEQEAAGFPPEPTIGTIAVAIALGYLDFRYAAEDWRKTHPRLAAWCDGFARRPSMATTVPKDPA
jgi:glutathione S-transferase